MHILSYGNEFDLQDNERTRKTHFNMIACATRLVLKQRQKQLRNALLKSTYPKIKIRQLMYQI